MFHAGVVPCSSPRLVQELYDPEGFAGLSARAGRGGPASPTLLEERADRGVYPPLEDPVASGLITPRLLCGPTVRGNLFGAIALACRLKAARHWRTCAGSLASYRSTVRKTSCGGRLSGGIWHARKKWEMFSICTKGADNCLNFTPGDTARFTNL